MNVKQLKALRKDQHDMMRSLRGQLGEDAWRRLDQYTASLVQMVKEANETREGRLLVENEGLKRQLAEQVQQHREALAHVKEVGAQELTEKLSEAEARYQKKALQAEERVAKLEHINDLAKRRLLQLYEIACTNKALRAVKSRFGEGGVIQLLRMAVDVIVMRIDLGKDRRWTWGEFEIEPCHTNKGWYVFIGCKGELAKMPTVLTVSEYALKRAALG